MYQTLKYSVDSHVATVMLDRPQQLNAIDMTLRAELADAVFRIQRDADVRAVVLTSTGKHFCSGGDIASMNGPATAAERRQRIIDLHPMVSALMTLDRPVIAAVPGVAFGAGCGLALTADFILATPQTRFCLSFNKVGLAPDFGCAYSLPRMVGLQKAKELIFSAREFDAMEAEELGIVYEIVAPDDLLGRANELARSFTEASPIALSIAKRALNVSMHTDLNTMLTLEADGQAVAFSTEWHRDAVDRFASKQKSRFTWPAKKRGRGGDPS